MWGSLLVPMKILAGKQLGGVRFTGRVYREGVVEMTVKKGSMLSSIRIQMHNAWASDDGDLLDLIMWSKSDLLKHMLIAIIRHPCAARRNA